MGTVYKLVELDICGIKRFTAKFSECKQTLPGAKQLFRLEGRDVLARSGECCTPGAEALLRPVILGGNLIEPLPDAHAARTRAAEYLAKLPPEIRELDSSAAYPVALSSDLERLIERTRRNLA
jgi:nicotinate phosphoribosyltransferase